MEVRVSSVDRSYAIARVNYLHPIAGTLGGDDNLWLIRRADGGWHARFVGGGRLSCNYVPAAVARDLLRNDPARRGQSCVKTSAFRVKAMQICQTMNRTLRARLPRTTAGFDTELDEVDALLERLGAIQPRAMGRERAWRDELRLLNRVSVSVRAHDTAILKAAIDMRKARNFYPVDGTPEEQRTFFLHAFREMGRATSFLTPGVARELAHDAEKLHLYGKCELQSVVPPPLAG